MFLGNVGNGEVVVAFNPIWAERFGAAFPDVDDLATYLRDNAWQPIDLWPAANAELLRQRDRVGRRRARVSRRAPRSDRPDRLRRTRQPARHRPAELRREHDAEQTGRPRGLTMEPEAVATAVDDVAGFLRADGADLLVREVNPKTARVHLELVLDERDLRGLRAAARRTAAHDHRRVAAADPGRVRGRARRSAPGAVSPRASSRPDAADPVPSWSALAAVYQAVLHDVVAALDEEAGADSGVFSSLAYLERAHPPHRLPMAELQRALHPRYSQPGFSRLVQRMETEGLVERRPDPADRRATIVVTTAKGRRHFRAANAVYADTLRDSFGRHLSADEHTRLGVLLNRVAARRESS